MLDLLIKNGQVVTPQGAGAWEIAVQDGKIAAVAAPGTFREATRVIDAADKVVVPGGVEPHTHLAHRIQMHPDDDLHTLGPEDDSRGMAFGGTTTHVDFAFVRPGDDLPSVVERRAARWKGNSYTDYTFHITLAGPLPLKTFDAIPEAIQQGFPSFKVFTTDVLPPHPKRPSNRLDFGRLQYAMEKVAPRGGIMVVHAEDHDVVQFMYERFREEGRMDGANLPLVHNKVSEMLSFRRAINLAAVMDAAIYFVHTSASEGVQAVAEARGHGRPIYAETLHHYTCFTADDYRSPRGFCYHTYPSLKYPEDQAALWDGLLNDAVSTTATDEYPTNLALKLRGKTIEDVTGGNLGAEARMGIVYTEGVVKRRMSLPRFVQVTSSNAARILGLYPRKGALAPGSDADIVLIDPAINRTLTKDDFHVSDYSPWEGWEVRGWPVTTILRGKVIVDQGRLHGDTRDGQLIPRKIDGAVLRRPAC
jgi:dihydropyrimidinase